MDFKTLVSFVRIAESGSFSTAARDLGYSQSALTMQIKAFEADLGATLFDRSGRVIRLTPAGERLLPQAVRILEAANEARQSVSEPKNISGGLVIGTYESYVATVMPEVLEAFGDECPDVETVVRTGSVETLFALLRQNDIDILYFMDKKVYFPDWEKIFERPVKIHMVASPDSELAGRKQIPLERLSKEAFYLTEKGISYRGALEQVFAARGIELKPRLEIGSTDAILSFVRKNKGISYLPDYAVRKYLKSGELIILDTEFPPVTLWSQLVYRKYKFVTEPMKRFMSVMERLAP